MASFAVASLFTRVPRVESLNLLGQHFGEDILALFRHVIILHTCPFVGSSTIRQMEGYGLSALSCHR
jgi:hypothetical protein